MRVYAVAAFVSFMAGLVAMASLSRARRSFERVLVEIDDDLRRSAMCGCRRCPL